MALAFLINKTVRHSSLRYRVLSENISPVYLFIAAIIPDLDFLFFGLIPHHTITHSLTFWSIAYFSLFLRFHARVLPYFIATISHLAGDFIMGKPTLFYGISNQGYGLSYDHIMATLNLDQFMLARSLLDFCTIFLFLIAYGKSSTPRILLSDKDAFVGLPILGILIISIFIASAIQDSLFSLNREHDWVVFIAAYSILAIAHLFFVLAIVREAGIFLKKKESETVRR
jgi:hypothetical protein